ncbi:putative Reverse transcriptase (RNA-dependent DNA polymerase) [Monocercomonoides exilis]|uniref:putative Reverse transcriptase (RNA-dependent DNA polymerase) n=1 Tax=Monocercomonoides exilis TaxID=2049356 RepID=UPI00355ACCCE|nr:putative Reverse transcriptase (RNA-dependent DNA polymerase) [Monocercomonoides exilis]|eukprot:MONOS_12062.1-p1 / transcript=MONOS_12062.1 / gene=MONOS_12062 / organism=Monocercomonoides_exilis_PA203 / gene_product=unspecified product / transcript_product=unspecified product / location=Mono_scaffold00641:16484-17590(-) / protein_length=368 / sequence_SO=supercontig / SO=protein_coding / is_pseudo=false
MRSGTEMQKQQVNVRGTLNSSDQRKEREREITGDSAREISIEDVGHETTRTEGDSEYPRVTGQKSERENGKIVWKTFGTVIESPIWSALEVSSKIIFADTHTTGDEYAQIQFGHKTLGVKRSAASGPPKEPLPGRLVNRLSEWKKIGGDKLVSRGIKARWRSPQSPISLEERKHRQEFRGTTEMMNNYLSLLEEELKEGVVKPIHESEVKWFNPTFMFRKKNGKWRKILGCRALNEEVQGKHFKMDSQETVVELLEENDWMTTLDISSACQNVKVNEQLIPYLCFSFQSHCFANVGMPFGAKDAPRIFTKIMRRATSYIREKWKVKQEIYLDDILLMHPDRDTLRLITQEIAQFLRNLGWILSEEKLK